MKRFVLGLFAGLAVTVATSLSSFAGYTGAGGTVSGSLRGLAPASGALGQQFTANDINNGATASFRANDGTGDFATGFDATNFFTGTYTFGAPTTVGATQTFSSADFGSFVGTVITDDGVLGDNSVTSRQIIFKGTFTPGSSASFNNNTTPLTNSLLQVTISKTSAGGSWTGAWTMDTTANASVPEPTSIAIFGLGAVGFAVRRFRRK